jgi:pimeloyl-ACP methyl ester carboxylesterase
MESLGIEYITNGFRHCYGTFRVAELHRDLGRVAEEMGNAIQMIKKHYDGMERNAATVFRYWAIRPQPANWTMPTWFTVGRLTYAANTRAVSQAIDLASRARLLPKAKTHPIERNAALQKLRDAALKFMLNAPLPTFTVPIISVPPKPKKKVKLSVELAAVEPMPMEPIPLPETMAA